MHAFLRQTAFSIGFTLLSQLTMAGIESTPSINAIDVEDTDMAFMEQKVSPLSTMAGSRFGTSSAISGDTAIVGNPYDNEFGFYSGSAHAFVRTEDGWIEEAKLLAQDGESGDLFGIAVAVCGDTAVVGAYAKREADNYTGCVYVFVRGNEGWTQTQKITPSLGMDTDHFGYSVALDNDVLVVGMSGYGIEGENPGNIYVYRREKGVWVQEAILEADDSQNYDRFGLAVAVSGDTIAASAPYHDTPFSNSGSAYIFKRAEDGWTQEAKLQPSNPSRNKKFGGSIDICGGSVVIGNSFRRNAQVFARTETTWSEQAILTMPWPSYDSHDVSISGDTIVIGDYQDDNSNGAVFLYKRTGITWTRIGELTLRASDRADHSWFGKSVDISGVSIIAGAPLMQDDLTLGGCAYIFEYGVPGKTVTFDLKGKGSVYHGELVQRVATGQAGLEPQIVPGNGWVFEAWDRAFDTISENTVVTALFRYDSSDLDSDHLWDGWERVHLLHIDESDGGIDSDKDGWLDRDEFAFGTDPKNTLSFPSITKWTYSEDGTVILSFNSNDDIPSRRYKASFCTSLVDGQWEELRIDIPPEGSLTRVEEEVPVQEPPQLFLKIEAQVPSP